MGIYGANLPAGQVEKNFSMFGQKLFETMLAPPIVRRVKTFFGKKFSCRNRKITSLILDQHKFTVFVAKDLLAEVGIKNER